MSDGSGLSGGHGAIMGAVGGFLAPWLIELLPGRTLPEGWSVLPLSVFLAVVFAAIGYYNTGRLAAWRSAHREFETAGETRDDDRRGDDDG